MSEIDITWQRTREYTATVNADDLRAALARVAKEHEGLPAWADSVAEALITLGDLDSYQGARRYILNLGALIAGDPEYYLEALEADDLNNCGAILAAEVTEIENT